MIKHGLRIYRQMSSEGQTLEICKCFTNCNLISTGINCLKLIVRQ